MKKLTDAAFASQTSIWQVLQDPAAKGVAVNGGTLKKLAAFRDMVQDFVNDNQQGSDAYELGRLIFNRSSILAVLNHDNTPESISKQENLKELLSGLKDFVDSRREEGGNAGMQEFLSDVMLITDQDTQEDDTKDKVTLMTCHAAKGLEFKHVYVVGVEEELLPSAMSMSSIDEVEEERRLLYVAMTRAKETCVLTYAKTRFRNGQTVQSRPSRFLSEIGRKFVKTESSSDYTDDSSSTAGFTNPMDRYNSYRRTTTSDFGNKFRSPGQFQSKYQSSAGKRQSSIENSKQSAGDRPLGTHSSDEVPVGTRILHAKLGEGVVTKLDFVMGEGVITVRFNRAGEKKLYLRFATFQII